MTMTKIEDVHYDDLLTFANTVLDLDVKRGTGRGKIVELIRAIDDTITEIELLGFKDEAPEADADMTGAPGDPAHYRNDPKVTVRIMTDPGEGGDRAVPLAVNGEWVLVKRDEQVPIPFRFYEVLQNCIATDMRQVEENGRFTTTTRDVQGLQFSVGDMPGRDEIAAYRARTASINSRSKARWMEKKRQLREAEAA